MPSAAEMRRSMERYLQLVGKGDVDGVLALFADSISVEDPVGGPPGTRVVGREAVEKFFREGFGRSHPQPALTGPVRTTGGNEAAMPFVLRLQVGGNPIELDVIDIMSFDEAGKITSLRAFWNFDEARPVTETTST